VNARLEMWDGQQWMPIPGVEGVRVSFDDIAKPACGEQTDFLVWPQRCTRNPNHYGERHHVDLPGLGSMTWGYLPHPEAAE
jgi:hypothetical protein